MSDVSTLAQGGRAASQARRQALSQGKSGLPAAAERHAKGRRGAPVEVSAAPAPAPAAFTSPTPSATVVKPDDCGHDSCRAAARARRASQARNGRGDAAPAGPTRPPRQGVLDYAPKVVASPTQGGQSVTGLRIGAAAQVTGAARGSGLPVSGSQYIGADAGAGWRAAAIKVGLSRTPGGATVSGALVRSRVAVTGDEAGGEARITGRADQRIEDDITPGRAEGRTTAAQFQRQADPHGVSVFGSNLARSAGSTGSRQRTRTAPLETTETGLAITGSAVGRAMRVTGDEEGACRPITGSQYLTPARRRADCGGPSPALDRADPVTGGRVRIAHTWRGLAVTGVHLEHDPLVTGEAAGSCAEITGTPYQGLTTAAGWCEPDATDAAQARLGARRASAIVSGDTATLSRSVTGAGRGAGVAISGTPYYGGEGEAAAPGGVDAIDARFSVVSPQRAAHLKSAAAGNGPGRITGSFALAQDKITGALDFELARRPSREGPTARLLITGEGRGGGSITGDSWAAQSNVTGVEGPFASARNPTQRAGEHAPFAGAAVFKAAAPKTEPAPPPLVTGLSSFASKARVTLSGGSIG
jgi:hypothetical protein